MNLIVTLLISSIIPIYLHSEFIKFVYKGFDTYISLLRNLFPIELFLINCRFCFRLSMIALFVSPKRTISLTIT